jgi:hypothetical protein
MTKVRRPSYWHDRKISGSQFEVIAELIRTRPATRLAAKLILFEGLSQQQAIERVRSETGTELLQTAVSNTLGRIYRTHEKIKAAYGRNQRTSE